jgi:hypothetical protein
LTFAPRPASGGDFGVNLVHGEMVQAPLFSAFPGFLEPVGGRHSADADLLVFGNRPSEQALDGHLLFQREVFALRIIRRSIFNRISQDNTFIIGCRPGFVTPERGFNIKRSKIALKSSVVIFKAILPQII